MDNPAPRDTCIDANSTHSLYRWLHFGKNQTRFKVRTTSSTRCSRTTETAHPSTDEPQSSYGKFGLPQPIHLCVLTPKLHDTVEVAKIQHRLGHVRPVVQGCQIVAVLVRIVVEAECSFEEFVTAAKIAPDLQLSCGTGILRLALAVDISVLHTRLRVLKSRGITTLFGQFDRLVRASNSWQAVIPLRHHYRDAGHVPLQKKVPVAEQFLQNIAARVACEIRLQHSAVSVHAGHKPALHTNSSMLAGVDGMQWRLFVCVMGEHVRSHRLTFACIACF